MNEGSLGEVTKKEKTSKEKSEKWADKLISINI